jgi:hypothetical protein
MLVQDLHIHRFHRVVIIAIGELLKYIAIRKSLNANPECAADLRNDFHKGRY